MKQRQRGDEKGRRLTENVRLRDWETLRESGDEKEKDRKREREEDKETQSVVIRNNVRRKFIRKYQEENVIPACDECQCPSQTIHSLPLLPLLPLPQGRKRRRRRFHLENFQQPTLNFHWFGHSLKKKCVLMFGKGKKGKQCDSQLYKTVEGQSLIPYRP